MRINHIYHTVGLVLLTLLFAACGVPSVLQKNENKNLPKSYASDEDTLNSARLKWKEYFTDPDLVSLIDTALKNNQELNIMMREINIANNEVRARKGEYLPFIGIGAGAGVEKAGRYTRNGALEENIPVEPGKAFPEPVPDFLLGVRASWELDIWKQLRNAKKAAVYKYLASVEGRNFMATNLVAEIANSYYELMALDNQLDILRKNIDIQTNALAIVKLQKEAARVTELAVRKFEAEVLKNQSHQFEIQQKIVETENHINFLVGRFPQRVERNSAAFNEMLPDSLHAGIPSQLLANRTDIRQAELDLAAARLNVKSARASFYPSLRITTGIGYQAFNPSYLLKSPESLMYTLGGDLVAPLINRNAIKANYLTANAKQVQAIYHYERTILNAYVEVLNQLSMISNLGKSYELKEKQVQALTQAIDVSTILFQSARADYMEILMTQRDALESRFDLIETRMEQMHARVNMYRALGGGWN